MKSLTNKELLKRAKKIIALYNKMRTTFKHMGYNDKNYSNYLQIAISTGIADAYREGYEVGLEEAMLGVSPK
jgi:hypothetical protein